MALRQSADADLDGGRATFSLGETAEEVALLDGVQEECDEWALRSHTNAVRAAKDGLFDAEIVGVVTADGPVLADEGPRSDTDLERLARLRPAFRAGGSGHRGAAAAAWPACA